MEEKVVDCGEIQCVCLQLSFLTGTLGHIVLGIKQKLLDRRAPVYVLAFMIRELFRLATIIGIDLIDAVEAKQNINERKYPKTECRADTMVRHFSEYEETTGVTARTACSELAQKIVCDDTLMVPDWFESEDTVDELVDWAICFCEKSVRFVEERGWGVFEADLSGMYFAVQDEMGELAGSVRYLGCSNETVHPHVLGGIASEICDVLIYTFRLARSLGLFDIVLTTVRSSTGL